MQINKEEFKAYEKVRSEGSINMLDIEGVKSKSGLGRKQILFIIKNYTKIKNEVCYGKHFK